MKIAGYIILVLGCLSFLGALVGGTSPFGPFFWIALGIFLLYKAKEKKNAAEKDAEGKKDDTNLNA